MNDSDAALPLTACLDPDPDRVSDDEDFKGSSNSLSRDDRSEAADIIEPPLGRCQQQQHVGHTLMCNDT